MMATLADLRESTPDGTLPAVAWPGGYPMLYLTQSGATICPKCANDPIETSDPVTAGDVYLEGPAIVCEDGSQCGAMIDGTWHAGTIESAYGDPDEPYGRAIAYARERGELDGTSAASWYLQDTVGGRVTRGADENARRILQGIEDGDPAVLNTFPFPDLSGEWADTLTGPELADDAAWHATRGHAADERRELADKYAHEWSSDICDAYETAFSQAVEDEIARVARNTIAD